MTFDIFSGEVVGLMGESGAGKTTLGLALLGLHDKERVALSGSALMHGQDLLMRNERALQKIRGSKISLISQEPGLALCPVRRVGEQIAEVMHAHGRRSWKECRAQAEGWLNRVGLEPPARYFAAYPHQLSGGQLQRVVLAQALICSPDLLIADEPTAALDACHQAQFVNLLREFKSRLGLAILLISHTPEIQASLADRLLIMRAGRIVEEGGLHKIFHASCEPYTRAMLRPIPRGATEYVEP
ncbi:MAG TPA: ABC transporter ATP-binding protein [Candidatus Aquilonibacter sp.]|nr:ABC transporter ATP-binding protein [Candidatus Aquilonibacter sp.]